MSANLALSPGRGASALSVVATLLVNLGLAWAAAERIQRKADVPAWTWTDTSEIQTALSFLAFYRIDRNSLLETLSFQIVFWAMLGYLAWLTPRYELSRA